MQLIFSNLIENLLVIWAIHDYNEIHCVYILTWMITREILARRRIAIWGLGSARIKKLKRTDPHFFKKQIRVCFLQLFDPSTPKASNRDPTAREYFTHNHSYKNSFKQRKISYIKFFWILELKVWTESRDNFLCFCTLSM